MKKILCRADGNAKTGLGHLYRMIAIAAFYKDDYELFFLTSSSSIASIIPDEFDVQLIPEEVTVIDEAEWLVNRYSPKEYIVIADGYQFTSSYQREVKKRGYILFYVDDLASGHMYADIVINHSPQFTKKDFIAEEYTQFALGTNYAMLRPKFNEVAKLKRSITDIDNAFVCFGGADKYDLSLKAVKALLKKDTLKEIHVVLGGAYAHQEIYDLNDDDRVFLHKDLDELSLCKLMQNCQIAIAPSSTILYELCSVKMPILSGYFVENQKSINTEFSKREVIFNGYDFRDYTIADFENEIDKILNNRNIEKYLLRQQELFDGKNKLRFLDLLNQFQVTCRKASEKDLMQVYNWSNDVLVRKNSYQSGPIKLETHTKWFLKKIKDPNTLFLIVEVNNKPAGIVRYTITESNAVVGVVVSNVFRGKKLASVFLIEGAKKYFEIFNKPILAYIKKENVASIKSFERAKYVYLKAETIQGSSSFVYKLEKSSVVE